MPQSTAQLLLSRGQTSRQLETIGPWLIGGVVLIVALIIIGKL